MSIVINMVGFQLVWFACVIGAARDMPLVGPAVFTLFFLFHFTRRNTRPDEAGLVVVSMTIGLMVDSLYVYLGLLRFASPGPVESLAPLWIVSLWGAFAMTLRHSLAWLADKSALSSIAGAIGGVLAYVAAERLGAVSLLHPVAVVLLVVGIAWALVTPSLFRIDRMLIGAVGQNNKARSGA